MDIDFFIRKYENSHSISKNRIACDPVLIILLRLNEKDVDSYINQLFFSIDPMIRTVVCKCINVNSNIKLLDNVFAELDDIVSEIQLSLIQRIYRWRAERALSPIASFHHYAIRVAKNACYRYFKRQHHGYAELENQIRYIIFRSKHSNGIDCWKNAKGELICGLSQWHGLYPRLDAYEKALSIVGLDANDNISELMVMIFQFIQSPLHFNHLIECLAHHKGMRNADFETYDPTEEEEFINLENSDRKDEIQNALENREILGRLLKEISELNRNQRISLILSMDEICLFLDTGQVNFLILARLLDMSVEDLKYIWKDLPYDDQKIASILYVTARQVNGYRKAARERLSRRISHL